jgi:hypothetical protein
LRGFLGSRSLSLIKTNQKLMISRPCTALILALALCLGVLTAPAGARAKHHRTHHRVCRWVKVKHHRGKRRRCKPAKRVRAAAASDSPLAQSGASAYGAQISWPTVNGATVASIYLNGQMIDQIGGRRDVTYEVPNLWPSSSFQVTVVLTNGAGQTLARYARTVSTTPAVGPFPRLFAPNSFINTPIPQNPSIAANSTAMVEQAIVGNDANVNLANNQEWGIPIAAAATQSTLYNVGCTDYGCATQFPRMHIPAGAAPDTGSDGHLVVLQPDGQELDMWVGQHTASGWTAGSRWVQSTGGPAVNCGAGHHCSGADAANFALAAGVIRPEEIAQGHIDHALAITTPDTRSGFIACPATNTDGHHNDPNALPIGAHVQLSPSVNVASLPIPGWQKVIAVALQQYGAYVIDTGGSVSLYAQSDAGRGYNAWSRVGVSESSPSLADLPWGSMRVLSMTSCGS